MALCRSTFVVAAVAVIAWVRRAARILARLYGECTFVRPEDRSCPCEGRGSEKVSTTVKVEFELGYWNRAIEALRML